MLGRGPRDHWVVSGQIDKGGLAQAGPSLFDPVTSQFTRFDLPLSPKGGDTPYALNVDRPRGVVWVNGNQSDSLYTFNIASETWQQIPMPRRVTFTRDVEFEPDGTAYTAIAHFPGWHVEDGQSTLIRVQRP